MLGRSPVFSNDYPFHMLNFYTANIQKKGVNQINTGVTYLNVYFNYL
jgi:hypothetical protein